MKTFQSKISRHILLLTLTLLLTGTKNKLIAQFTASSFVINNTSNCTVDVFFEFQSPCGGTFYCCSPAYVKNLIPGASITVPVNIGEDALIRVYPYGYCISGPCTYYFGNFTTSPTSGCYTPSIPAGTPASGDDCNGIPNALTAEVNGSCGLNCMNIW